MADDLIIDLGLDGIADMVRDINEVAKGVQESVGPTREIRHQLRFAAQNARRMADEMRRFFLFSQASTLSLNQMKVAMPAMTRGVSTPSTGSLASINRARNQQFAQSHPFLNAIRNAISTSRFGVGMGGHLTIMPLIGRTLAAFTKLGPAGVAISGVVAALALLTEAASHAAKTVSEFATVRMTTGATGASMAIAKAIASSMGMNLPDMAEMAQSFQGKVSSDPVAMAFSGMRDLPGAFGQVDRMRLFNRAVDKLLKFGSDMQALKFARATGLEGMLPFRALMKNPINRAEFGADRALTSKIFTPGFQQDAMQFQFQLHRFIESIQELLAVISRPVMRMFTAALELATTAIKAFTSGLVIIFDFLRQFAFFRNLLGPNSEEKKKNDALRENTDAMQSMTATMKGIFGGGERARGAIPRGLLGSMPYQQNEALRQGLRLGAFAL